MSTSNSVSEARRSKNAADLLFVIQRMKEAQQPSAAVTAQLGEFERLYAMMQRFNAPSRVCTSLADMSQH